MYVCLFRDILAPRFVYPFFKNALPHFNNVTPTSTTWGKQEEFFKAVVD
jgi:hypothetical protein